MSDSEGSCTKGQDAKIKQNDGSGTLTLTSNSMIFFNSHKYIISLFKIAPVRISFFNCQIVKTLILKFECF